MLVSDTKNIYWAYSYNHDNGAWLISSIINLLEGPQSNLPSPWFLQYKETMAPFCFSFSLLYLLSEERTMIIEDKGKAILSHVNIFLTYSSQSSLI